MYTIELDLEEREVEVTFNFYPGEEATYDYPGSADEFKLAMVYDINTGKDITNELNVEEDIWIQDGIEDFISNSL